MTSCWFQIWLTCITMLPVLVGYKASMYCLLMPTVVFYLVMKSDTIIRPVSLYRALAWSSVSLGSTLTNGSLILFWVWFLCLIQSRVFLGNINFIFLLFHYKWHHKMLPILSKPKNAFFNSFSNFSFFFLVICKE